MYREWEPPPTLRDWVACLWVHRGHPEQAQVVRVLPDACLDLMTIDGRLEVAGPDSTAQLVARPPGGLVVGVRFRPGAAGPALGVDVSALLDQRVDLADLWGPEARRLAERAVGAPTAKAGAGVLEAAVTRRVAGLDRPDPAIQAIVLACREAGGRWASAGRDPEGAWGVLDLAAAVGLSERQLRRRSLAALGYGPRTLQRIIRFQRFIGLAEASPRPGLAALAASAGYADQAHLSRECQRLARRSPAVLLAERAA
jgi:AraC-like DNA-binding protein